MIYIKWFCFLIVNILTNYLINIWAVYLVVPFANKAGWLPWYLWYFQTPDNPIKGDARWQLKHLNDTYLDRVAWLHRNKLYGFGSRFLSIECKDTDSYFFEGKEGVRNAPSPGVSGLAKFKLYREGKLIAFQIYYIRQWKHWPNKCIRLNMGFKIWHSKPTNVSFVFSPALFMTFSP